MRDERETADRGRLQWGLLTADAALFIRAAVGPCAQTRPGALRALASFVLPAGLVTLGSWLSARRSVSENATRRVAASRSVRRRRGHSGPLRRAFFHLIGLNLMQLNPTAPKHFALSDQLIAVSPSGARVKTCSPPSRPRNPESLPLFSKQEWRLRASAPCTRPELTS